MSTKKCPTCNQNVHTKSRMPLPTNTALPFFAYGLFQSGQLGYLRIKQYVDERTRGEVEGQLLERDGLLILKEETDMKADGELLTFKENVSELAYASICEIEPQKQYLWNEIEVRLEKRVVKANVLLGRKPDKGSDKPECSWEGRKDPFFTSSLDVIAEVLLQNTQLNDRDDLKPLLKLEMAYLLLWASIERYASLRYDLSKEKATAKVENLIYEVGFQKALQEVVKDEIRTIYAADNPNDKYVLNASDTQNSFRYYYQMRSNITHRGKSVFGDFEKLRKSSAELLEIFRKVIDAAFEEAKA